MSERREKSKYKQRHPIQWRPSEEHQRWLSAALKRDEDAMERADRAWKARFMPKKPQPQQQFRRAA
jgi:hypothetical protein